MKKGRLQEIIKELQGASKMHLKQSKDLASYAEDITEASPAKQNSNEVNVQDSPNNMSVNERLDDSFGMGQNTDSAPSLMSNKAKKLYK